MELFNYANIGAAAKYVDEIHLGCLIVTAVIFLISVLVSFIKDMYSEGFVRFLRIVLRLILSCGVAIGLLFITKTINNNLTDMGTVYDKYTEMYETGECKIITGRVENFTPATTHKSFTVDGVSFTIYPAGYAKPSEGTNAVLYYTYSEAGVNYEGIYADGYWHSVKTYKPEKCVILGDNQYLEIHYVVEDGENRILYIKELSE